MCNYIVVSSFYSDWAGVPRGSPQGRTLRALLLGGTDYHETSSCFQ